MLSTSTGHTAMMGSWCIGSICMPCTYATLRLHPRRQCSCGNSKEEAYAVLGTSPQQGTPGAQQPMGRTPPTSACQKLRKSTLHQRRQCSCRESKEEDFLVLGTSSGHLQLHSSDGQLMHRQRLHAKAVTAISVRCAGMQAGSDDASEDVTVCFEDAVARVSSLEV